MRLVHANVRPEALGMMKDYYEGKIIPALERTPGCLYACLMRSEGTSDKILSMTLWETQRQADAYEQSGPFRYLMDGVKPYLAESSEWKIQLTSDLKLEYAPVADEPTVSSYAISASSDAERSDMTNDPENMYLRIVIVTLKPGAFEEFNRFYTDQVIPALRERRGCLHAYLTAPHASANEATSVTIWARKEDAATYEQTGKFRELLARSEHLYSDLFQWKMHLDGKHSAHSATSDDLQVQGYMIVTGKALSETH